jgi:hypothetical protein
MLAFRNGEGRIDLIETYLTHVLGQMWSSRLQADRSVFLHYEQPSSVAESNTKSMRTVQM